MQSLWLKSDGHPIREYLLSLLHEDRDAFLQVEHCFASTQDGNETAQVLLQQEGFTHISQIGEC